MSCRTRLLGCVGFGLAVASCTVTQENGRTGDSELAGDEGIREGDVAAGDADTDSGNSDTTPADATTESDCGDTNPGDAPEQGDAGSTCSSQCECPAGTLCTIDHVCVGSQPYTQSCDSERPCPCGKPCVDGYCSPRVGSLRPCQLTCECGAWEVCSAGQCVFPGIDAVSNGTTGCAQPSDCAQCTGTVCLLPANIAQCAAPDRCVEDGHCLLQMGSGFQCVCDDGSRDACPNDQPQYIPLVPGRCVAIPGQSYVDDTAVSLIANPTGLECGIPGSPLATLNVSGVVGTPSAVLLYTEFSTQGAGVAVTLHGPGGASGPGFSTEISLWTPSDTPRWEQIQPLEGVTIFNGTWSLCQSQNPAHTTGTITRWGLYFVP